MSKVLRNAAIGLVVAGTVVAGVCSATNAKNSTDTNSNNGTSQSQSSKLVDENVYVFARADGSTRKIVTSDWTKTLDVDEYTNFQTDDKKLPIDMKVSYKLNGNDISAKDLAGKSGRVTMRYEYTNKEMVGSYYVPYAIVSGMMLDNEHFKNVDVTNGKLVNDGNRTIVAGIMMPGMQENLGLDSSVFEIPSYLEVSADVSEFELGMTVSIATNEVFKDLDFSAMDSIDQLSSQLDKLSNAMSQLVGGSSDLADGIEKLYQEASKLPAGVAALSDGAGKLKNGTSNLAAGAEKLSTGAKTLQGGVEQLYDGINENFVSQNVGLQTGAANAFQGTLALAYPNISAVLTACNITQIDFMTDYAGKAMENTCFVQQAAQNPDTVGQVKALLDGMYALKNGITSYTYGIAYTNETMIKNKILAGITAEDGLVNSTTKLAAGATTIADGASELSSGLDTLNASTPALVDGVQQLRDGSAKLASGIKQFNKEGVQKLVSVYNNDIKGLINKLQDIANVAKNNSKNTKYIYRTDEIKK